MRLLKFMVDRAVMWVVATLITLQGLVVWADLVLPTGPFDELAGLIIVTMLGWLTHRQRQLGKQGRL